MKIIKNSFEGVKVAAEILKENGVVAFPTETVYGLGANAFSQEAITKVFKIKRRPSFNPLIIHVSSFDMAKEYGVLNDLAKKLTQEYWPGPLTIIIPTSEKSKSVLSSSDFTLGLRIPNSTMAKFLIKESGPLLTSSANLSGRPSATISKDISIDLPNVDILGPVPWEKCSGKASTIIYWRSYRKWETIRKGQVFIPGIK